MGVLSTSSAIFIPSVSGWMLTTVHSPPDCRTCISSARRSSSGLARLVHHEHEERAFLTRRHLGQSRDDTEVNSEHDGEASGDAGTCGDHAIPPLTG